MNNEERKIFWDTLNNLDGIDKENDFIKIKTSIHYPEELCKFKKVNDYSLLGLQTNQLYIPSTIQYDDPFDTYLYFDHKALKDKINSHFINKTEPIFNIFCDNYNISATAENRQQAYYNIDQNIELVLQDRKSVV